MAVMDIEFWIEEMDANVEDLIPHYIPYPSRAYIELMSGIIEGIQKGKEYFDTR